MNAVRVRSDNHPMPNFAYTARDSAGQSVSGILPAANAGEVARRLRGEGKFPTSVELADVSPGTRPANLPARNLHVTRRAGVKVTRAEVISVATQWTIMLETGVTLTETLECVAAQSDKPNMRSLLADLLAHVQGGGEFSAALERHPRSFPHVFVALVRASEKTGMLPRMLSRANGYLRDEQEIRRKVRGALTYPSVMLGFAVVTTLFLLAFVLPRFTAIYANKAAALPLPTKILMGSSDLLLNHALILLPTFAAAAAGLWYAAHTPAGRRAWQGAQLRVPLLGPMFRQLHLARGLRVIGTLTAAGVTLVDGVETARDLSTNARFNDLWNAAARELRAGKQLSEPLFASPLVPRGVSQMLCSGERGGRLTSVMEQVAGFTEVELKEKIADLTRYIEPAMIVLMGLLIGGVALALMLPVFTISKVVAG